jgi:putative transport protein
MEEDESEVSAMVDLLGTQPLLLLFVVAALGYPLGRVKVFGCSLGLAAVLFVGLAFGALGPQIKLPEIVYQLGLVVFVYTIGLSSGPAFSAALRRKGMRDTLFVLAVLSGAAILTVVLTQALGLQPARSVGVFAGSLTNTPALASVIEQLTVLVPDAAQEHILAEPVIGYSITYPIGVLGVILAIIGAERLWHIDYAAETTKLGTFGTPPRLANCTVRVVQPQTYATLVQRFKHQGWDVLVGRVKHQQQFALATSDTVFAVGDLVSLIGPTDDVAQAIPLLGTLVDDHLEADRHEFDYRRMFVSNPAVAGHTLQELALPQRFGAMVTRVRSGDNDRLAHTTTVLELGDRVRVVAPPERMEAVRELFGDSYRTVSEVDILTFNLGLALGMLVGLIPLPFPGGAMVKLGLAGGPLLVALVLGTLKRSGPLVWSLPYSANITLRQLGLVLFLAGIGTRAGYAFLATLNQGGLILLGIGACITCTTALTTLWIGHRLFHIPFSVLIGMLAGLQTQPAALGFALERTNNDAPNIGYAMVYPVATIAKIVLVQIMLAALLPG